MEDLEIHHLTIHGRSRPQKYDGYSRWILITQVAERVPFPVAASGDITSFKSILDRHHYFDHIDHAIVGRGAPHNPWLFKEIRQGNPQKISPQTLPTILASLGLLYEAQSQNLYGLWDIPCHSPPIVWMPISGISSNFSRKPGLFRAGRNGEALRRASNR